MPERSAKGFVDWFAETCAASVSRGGVAALSRFVPGLAVPTKLQAATEGASEADGSLESAVFFGPASKSESSLPMFSRSCGSVR